MAVSYHYNMFPPDQFIDWTEIVGLLEPAIAALARYDGVLSGIPNSALLFSPLTTQEAVLSSQIEGTQATMGEVLKFEADEEDSGFSETKKNDIHEILNYRRAIRHAMNELKTMPLCQRVVKSTHEVLMDSVRGANRDPGEYRKIPNWIGPPGCKMEDASYIPISADKLQDGMSDWEKYLNSDQKSKLVQLAVLHAEFESLHPFLDGNGRLGRMIIPLFLFSVGMIKSPMFYISAYFDKHKTEYYQRLRDVSERNDWTDWCKFFLVAVAEQSEINRRKAEAIINLYNTMKAEIPNKTRSQYGIVALDFIFDRPIFNASEFIKQKGLTAPTARRILTVFRESGILNELAPASGRRSAVYSFDQVLNLAEGYEAF